MQARMSNATGRPAAEVIARALEARDWNRREMLVTTAAATAGIAMGCGRRSTGSASGAHEVAIIGAGIAGLTAAYRLTQAGVRCRVYEAQNRIGGRMWSLRDHFPENQVCELGGELVDTGHVHLRGLCAELGLELDDFDQDDPTLAREVWYFDGRRISDEEVVEAFRPIAARMDEAWESLTGDTVSYREPNGGEAVDRMSIAEWLDAAGASGWFRTLLEVGYVTEYGLEIDEQSAWNLLMLIDTQPDPFRIFGDSDERFHIRGGNDLVPTRLAERLDGRIEIGHRLESIRQDADGRYRLAVAHGGGAKDVVADHVVLTLPFTMLREVELAVPLPEVKRRAVDTLGYGTNAKLMVGFSERVWRTSGGSNGSVLTDLPFQLAWESTRLQPGQGGIVVGYTGGRRGVEIGAGSPEVQAERLATELERVFPGIAEKRTDQVRFHWPTFPWVKGSYACYLPGQWTTISGAEGERVGNLHFAGEHTSVDNQGYMEGGCESGERAAREIIADLGIETMERAG
jgi:monoamine oxidase